MSISSLNSTQSIYPVQNPLLEQLKESGVSKEAANEVLSDIQEIKETTRLQDPAAVRAALDDEIAEDVANGTLTQEEADQITAALDEFEATLAANPPAQGGAPAGGGGGGGGAPAGGSTESEGSSTEVVNVETSVSDDGMVTKTTTYADDSQKTTTTYDPTQDKSLEEQGQNGVASALQSLLQANGGSGNSRKYLNNLLSSGRVNIVV